MKVLTISTIPFSFNGISNVILNYYKNLDNEDITMDFVFPENSDKKKISNQIDTNISEVYYLPSRTKNLLKYRKNLNQILLDKNYDVVHIHGNSSTMVIELQIAKKNQINKRLAHTHAKFTKFPLLNKILAPTFKSLYTNALAPSKESGDFLFGENNYQIIKNGIPINEYYYTFDKRKRFREEFDLKDSDIVIGNIGRLAKEKNQKYLMDLLIKLDDIKFKLFIIGEGPLEYSLKELVKEYDLEKQVFFTGNRNDVTKLLSGVDILIIPSLSEGLGITAIEAQAAEVPVFISENIPEDVFQTPLALPFRLNNMNDLINRINALPIDTLKRQNNHNNKYMRDSSYNIKNSVKDLAELYMK